MSVRHEIRGVRRKVGERLLYLGAAVGIAAAFALQFGCDGWPPGKRTDAGTGGGVENTNGTCSGSPLPCAGLIGADCSSDPGCIDEGSCTGTATSAGQTCATSSPTVCGQTPGCYWSGACTGTPFGTCSAFTESACLQAKGCVWTPTTTVGAGGATTTACLTYLAPCTTIANCDCGFTCVQQCPACASICGIGCQTNADCTTASNAGVPTPFCHVVQAGSRGLCSQTQ